MTLRVKDTIIGKISNATNADAVPWSGVTGKPSTFTPSSHTHDDRYYTETEVNSKLGGKANSSHNHDGVYVPTTEAGTNAAINRLQTSAATPVDGDYYISQWAGQAASTAEKNQYIRRPVSALWNYIKSKADSVYATKSHTHNYAGSSSAGGAANWANGADFANYAFSENGVSTSGSGSAYTANVHGFSLATGKSIVMIPNVTSTTTTPTLNVSGTGAKNIRMRLSSNSSSTIPLIRADFLNKDKPVRLTYNGLYWVIDDFIQPDANNLYGTLISRGSSAPSSRTDGFIYIQTT